MLYSEQVLSRFQNPQFVYGDEALQAGSAGSRLAGVHIVIYVGLYKGLLQARFRAYGCPASIASADWLAERIDGTEPNAARPDRHAIIGALVLSSARRHCAALAVEAMQHAFEAFEKN